VKLDNAHSGNGDRLRSAQKTLHVS
jgi:hypothetical protein